MAAIVSQLALQALRRVKKSELGRALEDWCQQIRACASVRQGINSLSHSESPPQKQIRKPI
ncbi:MAG: hypothetical protein MUE44_22000 [Oscillatoriaceae cyanobacterium Prado104]|nr:hypothetical protein [Oscillatoriaceae cyanobacterium Prado104]